METISNIASTATTTVSNLIYGNQDAGTKTNETAGQEPVSGQTGKGTVDEPYDQGNSEVALDKNTFTTDTSIEQSKVVEPTGSIQKPEDLIKAYKGEAGDATTASSTGITHTSTDTSSTGKDTLWRGVDAYKDTSSTGPDPGTGVKPLESTSTPVTGPNPGTGVKPLEPTSISAGSTSTGTEPTHFTSSNSTTGGPKGDVEAEPKNYSIGDLTSGKDTPATPVGENTTSATTTSHTDPKSSESAISPPDLSSTSPGEQPKYSADTHEPSPKTGGTWTRRVGNVLNKADGVAGLVGERAGHGGPSSGIDNSNQGTSEKKSSVSPSGEDEEKSGKMDKLKDKLKNKLHIGSKDH